ncbi:hypothetical protein [Gordonia aurantiaca]|uniref:hypothetical protein n=1 Tax=Gordonia sp. B21 TaxID=3151852 RepID=UPI00326635C3
MTPRGPDDATAGEPPEPPFPAEMLADLHAGLLPERTAEHIRSRLDDDPHARRVLAALDRTVDELRGSPPAPVRVPDFVRADVQATLASLNGPSDAAPAPVPCREQTAEPDDLAARRRRNRVLPALITAAALVIVAAGTVGVLFAVSSPDSGTAPPQARSAATASLDPSGSASALSVIGRTDGAPFGSVAALRRCTSAHLVSESTAVVGSGRIVYQGEPAAAILLSTGVAGRFDALIVGLDCDTGNPSLLARGVIGN